VKFPSLTGKEIVEILKKIGFEEIRQRGSHVFLKHPDGRITGCSIAFRRNCWTRIIF